MVSIIADGLAILTIAVASIPLMQKLAFVAAFWIISIFISVVTLHPIILTFVRPPKEHRKNNLFDRVANALGRRLVTLAVGNMRYAVVAAFVATMVFGVYFAHQLKTGDTSPGMALLYPDHPYNVANATANQNFVGTSPLVIIAEGKKPGAIKDANTLNQLDLFQRYMEQGEGAGGSVTATTMLKTIFRIFHEGDPKWEMLPTRNDHVGQLFFLLTAGTRRGEIDRFFSPDYTNATITIFYKNYDHETIKNAIERAKEYIATHTQPDDSVRYRLAGGLFGILAAQIEEVDWSYRVNVPLIFLVVFILSFVTYWSVLGALIVMLPSIVAQPLSEAVMYLIGIDFNINSLPVAAIGIGIGIDYGYYVLSRIVEEYEVTRDFDEANRRALTTTGEAVMFTGVTITASMILWLFHPLKFEAQMAFLLMMLMVFHAIGALVFIPAMVSLLRPRFATAPRPSRSETRRAPRRRRRTARVGRGRQRRALAARWTSASPPPRRPSAPRCAPGSRDNLPPGWGTPAYRAPRAAAEKIAASKAWQATLCTTAAGPGITWPREYGGRGATLRRAAHLQRGVRRGRRARQHQPRRRARARRPDADRLRHRRSRRRASCRRILRGDDIWCQGFSEPNAGSDLAALTHARRGATATTSSSPARRSGRASRSYADWCILVVRTDPSAPQAQRADLPARRHEEPRHHHPAAGRDDRRGLVQRGLLRRRAGAARQRGRRDRPRLGRRDHDAGARARRHRAARAPAPRAARRCSRWRGAPRGGGVPPRATRASASASRSSPSRCRSRA